MLLDKLGRPICGYCLRPMIRAAKYDHAQRDGQKVGVFDCQSCGAVETFMLPGMMPTGGGVAA